MRVPLETRDLELPGGSGGFNWDEGGDEERGANDDTGSDSDAPMTGVTIGTTVMAMGHGRFRRRVAM